ncbi:MAG: hypothetical protein ACRDHP_00870, partial [Ktedonobacterales bacterium]
MRQEHFATPIGNPTPSPLRSLDAIHLASALVVAASIVEELVFVTSDERLEAVAQREGLQTLNPAFS